MKPDTPPGKRLPETAPQPRTLLVQARVHRKLTQEQVAQQIGTTSVNISRWERGITKPSPYFRRRLVRLYGKTEEELDLAPASGPLPPFASPMSGTAESLPTLAASPISQALPTSTPSLDSPILVTPAAPVIDPTIPNPPANPLVGRDKVLEQLKQRLCEGGNVALTALNGLPGVGKTTLAITIVHDPEIRTHFNDGILWAGLGPQPNLSGIFAHWGALLGVSQEETSTPNDTHAWAGALRRVIGQRHMLLVIDDAWSMEAALVLKVGGPNCAHLITTRFPSIANQLGINTSFTISELDENESVMLLGILAPQLAGNEQQSQRAHELAHAVGGLPLALTLAGNYLRRHSYSGQPRRVEAALNRLSNAVERLNISEPHSGADRHPSLSPDTPISLQSVISVTDRQLTPEQQYALRALSIFPPKPASFSEEAALHVANCTTDTLDALIDYGLLEWSEHGRYTMHQTIADYARSRLLDTTPYKRLADYMATLVSDYRKDYARLEPEEKCIEAALEAAYDYGYSDALMRCIYNYIPYLRSRGQYTLAQAHLQHAYQAAERNNDLYGKAGALLYLGEISQKQGNYELATSNLQEGLALARQVGEKERITALLANLGRVMWKRGEYSEAEQYLEEGLAFAKEINDKEHISYILETLGSIVASRGDYDKSKDYMEDALEVAREMDDKEKICTLLINLGVTEGERGNYKDAEMYFLEALYHAKQIGHIEWISLIYSNLGDISIEQEDYLTAEEYFQDGLTLARQLGNGEWISALLSNLGQAAQKQGHYNKAKDYLVESLTFAQQINRPRIIFDALYAYGNLCLDWQQPEIAEMTFREMQSFIPKDSPDLFAIAQYGLARSIAAQKNLKDATMLALDSLNILETMGHRTAKEVKDWLQLINE